ncbi:MAG: hypothetical protein LBI03_11980 [Clostridiales bacterium]|jgi:hypothetical protein|nr:hypothetical protein [Clostridiales bacterium]
MGFFKLKKSKKEQIAKKNSNIGEAKSIDVAVSFNNKNAIFEFIDEFMYENKVFAFMHLVEGTDAVIFEELELDGRRIGKGLEDICFINCTNNPVLQTIAQERYAKKESTCFSSGHYQITGLRSLREYEMESGHRISTSEDMIFYHDKLSIHQQTESELQYDVDTAYSITQGQYYEALDVFTCGLGLYAMMVEVELRNFRGRKNLPEPLLMEILDLDGRKLSEELTESHLESPILDDYCFIINTQDIIAMSKGKHRIQDGTTNPNGLATLKLSDARTLSEIEEQLGCSVLDNPQARSYICVHKKGRFDETDCF